MPTAHPSTLYADRAGNAALVIDGRSPEGRYELACIFWRSMWAREVEGFLARVPHRLAVHRDIQAKERAGVALTGYYASSAQSRADLVAAIRKAREVRADFLRRRPEPQLADFRDFKAAA